MVELASPGDPSRPQTRVLVGTPSRPRSLASAVRRVGRVLVIERDDDYAALIATLLQRDGWESQRERDPRAGLRRLNAADAPPFDVILVSTPAEPIDGGESSLSALRSASHAPLIALCDEESGNDRLEQAVEQAVEAADYNLFKPFSPRRFRAAVRAVVRRGAAGTVARLPAEVRVGGVTMSYGRLEVTVDERTVELSPREFALLHLLLANPGTVFTRDELVRLAWGWKGAAESRAVDNTVQRLRRKIEPDSRRPRYLLTERGTGYRYAAADDPAAVVAGDER
jgi:two-component system response regulator VicR